MKNLSSLGRGLATLLLLGLAPVAAQAQTGAVGIGTTTPNASAALDVSSTSKGFLPPRLSTAQRDAMSPAPTAAAAGLTIYNTDTQNLNTWDGTKWLLTPTYTSTPPPASLPDVTFNYTGNTQTYTVPASVRQLTVAARGAAGSGGQGGLGAVVQATLTVVPGEVLTVEVGGTPYNGGGAAYIYAGGGATDLRRLLATGRTDDYLASRNALLVAGGGGGMGSTAPNGFPFPVTEYSGGAGGTPAGGSGNARGGAASGATQQGPGTGNGSAGFDGTNNQGGASTNYNGSTPNNFAGGGGGGYYGGGGGNFSSGGSGSGGSSWTAAGATNVSYAVATAAATGSLTITPIPSLPTITYNPSPTGSGSGSGTVDNLTGDVTSTGLATTYNNVVPAAKGGAGTVSGLLKADGSGTVSAATPGTDYLTPAGAATGFVQNQTSADQTGGFRVAGTGTVGGLLTAGSASVNGPATVAGNTIVGGTLGIGTTTAQPATQRLDVRGNVRLGDDGGQAAGTGQAIEWVGPGVSSDPVGIYRVNPNVDQSELRVVVGDVPDPSDKFVVGRMGGTSAEGGIPTGSFTPTFSVSATGQVNAPGLAGPSTRVVTADASGTLATQALPTDAQQLSISGSTLALTNGGSVTLPIASGDNLGNHLATQNLNLGTNALVGNGGTTGLSVDAAGNAQLPATNAYRYAAPKAYTIYYGATDFQPESSATANDKLLNPGFGSGDVYTAAAGGVLRAPVHLPVGAVITNIELYYVDNSSTGDLTVSLRGYNPSVPGSGFTPAIVTTGGTPGFSRAVFVTTSGGPISANLVYYLRAVFGEGSTDLTIRGVRINYTVTQAE